jgi:hypothetical protein
MGRVSGQEEDMPSLMLGAAIFDLSNVDMVLVFTGLTKLLTV